MCEHCLLSIIIIIIIFLFYFFFFSFSFIIIINEIYIAQIRKFGKSAISS